MQGAQHHRPRNNTGHDSSLANVRNLRKYHHCTIILIIFYPDSQDGLRHSDCWKACAWEAQNDLEAADREGLQRVELSAIDLVLELELIFMAAYQF